MINLSIQYTPCFGSDPKTEPENSLFGPYKQEKAHLLPTFVIKVLRERMSAHKLMFHNAEHAEFVSASAVKIGKAIGVDTQRLELAGLAHDIVQGKSFGENETATANEVGELFKDCPELKNMLQPVRELIIATTPTVRFDSNDSTAPLIIGHPILEYKYATSKEILAIRLADLVATSADPTRAPLTADALFIETNQYKLEEDFPNAYINFWKQQPGFHAANLVRVARILGKSKDELLAQIEQFCGIQHTLTVVEHVWGLFEDPVEGSPIGVMAANIKSEATILNDDEKEKLGELLQLSKFIETINKAYAWIGEISKMSQQDILQHISGIKPLE